MAAAAATAARLDARLSSLVRPPVLELSCKLPLRRAVETFPLRPEGRARALGRMCGVCLFQPTQAADLIQFERDKSDENNRPSRIILNLNCTFVPS